MANALVYYAVAVVYGISTSILLIAINLDQAERKKRKERAIVPEESVPCAMAEQFYLDEQVFLHSGTRPGDPSKKRMTFTKFLILYAKGFPRALSLTHLLLSFLIRGIPTFTRLKRGLLIALQLHICVLGASIGVNILEHQDLENKHYKLLGCENSACTDTLPLALIAAVAAFPVFRFAAYRQLRLTCFMSQGHLSTSPFPLNVRKFAFIPRKSLGESFLCMRNAYERRKFVVLNGRSLVHRFVQLLWNTTQPSVKDMRLYTMLVSWFILFFAVGFMVFTLVYVLEFTVYLRDDVVFHWVAWTWVMFLFSIFVVEPAWIFFYQVVWFAFCATIAQQWGFGIHSLSASLQYRDVVRQVESLFFGVVRVVSAMRLQRWWRAVLDMYKAIQEQTVSAIKIQAMRKKMIEQKKYAKNRKWCMKIEVVDCGNLSEVELGALMSPTVKLVCDTGNPQVMQTKVCWNQHQTPKFGESFFVDIKDSKGLYLTVWSKDLNTEEFVGRGYFEFDEMKLVSRAAGHPLKLQLYDIQHGEQPSKASTPCGHCNLRINFLDPSKEYTGDNSWMLPKHRMQFALGKVGGRLRVGQMLGAFGGAGEKATAAVVKTGGGVADGPPASGPPASGPPASGPPASGPPASGPPPGRTSMQARPPASGPPASGISLTPGAPAQASPLGSAQLPGSVDEDDDEGA